MENDNVEQLPVGKLGIKEARALNEILNDRMHGLSDQLTNALPSELQEKYGFWDATSNIVWNGGCTFTIFTNVGLYIDDAKKEEHFENARIILQPIIKAWSRFGIVLKAVSFVPVNDGVIEAHLELS